MTPATILEHDNIKQPVTEWALDYGITPAIIIGRLERGDTVADAIMKPMKTGYAGQRLPIFSAKQKQPQSRKPGGTPARTYTHDGKSLTIAEWSRATGLTKSTIGARLRKGWSVERTLTTPRDRRGPKPGVVSNLTAFEGTGAGSTAQETSKITFSGNEACPQ